MWNVSTNQLYWKLVMDTLDPSANIIDVYIWMLFDDVGPGIL